MLFIFFVSSIKINAQVPCSGVPATNTLITSGLPICPASSTTVGLQNSYTVTGLWYQWQSSTTSSVGPWTSISGATLSTLMTPTLNTSTYFMVVVTCTNGGGSSGITAIQVTVAPSSVSVTAITANTANICNGQSASLTATAIGTINWYANSTSTISLGLGGSYTTPSLTTGNYTFYAQASSPCATLSPRTPITITVNSHPIISVNSGTTCAGVPFTLTPSGALSYTVSGGLLVVTPITNASYTVSGTGLGNCVSLSSAVSNVSVSPSPTIIIGNDAICRGESYTLAPTGALSYTYSSGSAVVSPTGTTSYTVWGTGANGCVSIPPGISFVSVKPLPTISVNSNSICLGDSFTINPSGASTYTYSSGSNVITPTITSNYTVTGTGINGCVNAVGKVCTVTVLALPTIILGTSNPTICINESATITANGAISYTWNTNQNSGNIVVNPTITSNFVVTGNDALGCSNTAAITQNVSSCTGLSQGLTFNSELDIYPNPNNGEFYLKINQAYSSHKIQLYNIYGQFVFSTELKSPLTNIKLIDISSGVYFLNVDFNTGEKMSKKIIIQN
jgi:Secretion system C-terminal sorting domain/Ig-like domain CHU_C associated